MTGDAPHNQQSRSATALDAQIADFHARRRQAETAFGTISYWERGDGPEAAVFLHGWPLNGFHWRDAMAGLSHLRRCIAPDFMGLGYSDVPEGADLSPDAQCEMIVAVMDALGVRCADFVSNDSGTTVAQLLAVRHPDRVASLLLTNGDVHTNSPPELLKPALEAARAGLLVDMFERHLTEPGFAQSEEGLGTLTYTDPATLNADLAKVYIGPLLAAPKRRRQCQKYGVAFEPNPLPAIETALRRLAIPVAILWGTKDRLFPAAWADWLARTLPHARKPRMVPGANLFFTEEYPELVTEEATRLWSEQ